MSIENNNEPQENPSQQVTREEQQSICDEYNREAQTEGNEYHGYTFSIKDGETEVLYMTDKDGDDAGVMLIPTGPNEYFSFLPSEQHFKKNSNKE